MTSWRSWRKGWRRVYSKQRGGFVPSGLTARPTHSSLCGYARSSRQHHSFPASQPAWLREEAHELGLFRKAGATTHLDSSRTEPRRVGARSSGACPCRRERAGRAVNPLGTKPPLCVKWTLRFPNSNRAKTSSRMAAARNLAMYHKRRARRKASLAPAWARAARPSTHEARPRLLGIEECPHFN
jgi:hypothetical protein